MTNFKDINEALDEISVSQKEQHDIEVVSWWPDSLPWSVSTPSNGIVAIFSTEKAACQYRLMLITQYLNDGWHK